MEGALTKRGNGRISVSWRARHVVLSGSLLAYFDDEARTAARGVVDLCDDGLALEWGPRVSAAYARPLCFHIRTRNRVYAFQAARVDDLSRWVAHVRAHVRAARTSAVSLQMRTCRQLTARLRADGFLSMAAADSAMTVSVSAARRGGRLVGGRAPPRARLPTDTYTLSTVLGKGMYGTVRLVREKVTGREFALKEMVRPRRAEVQGVLRDEIRVMEHVRAVGGHPHVIALHEVMEDDDHVWLVLELADGGHLMDAISAASRFAEADARRYFRQIASAVAFLHANNVLHRDLKPENLQLSADGCVKLLDFGFATRVPDPRPLTSAPASVASRPSDGSLSSTAAAASGRSHLSPSARGAAVSATPPAPHSLRGGDGCGGGGAAGGAGGTGFGITAPRRATHLGVAWPKPPSAEDHGCPVATAACGGAPDGAGRPRPTTVRRNASWAGSGLRARAAAQQASRIRRAAIRARALARLTHSERPGGSDGGRDDDGDDDGSSAADSVPSTAAFSAPATSAGAAAADDGAGPVRSAGASGACGRLRLTTTDSSRASPASAGAATAGPAAGGAAAAPSRIASAGVLPVRTLQNSSRRARTRRALRASLRQAAAAPTPAPAPAPAPAVELSSEPKTHRARLRRSVSELGAAAVAEVASADRGAASDGDVGSEGDECGEGSRRGTPSLEEWAAESGQPAWMETEKLTTYVGTRYACAPEVQDHRPYCRAADVWGLGVILYMLLLGRGPVSDEGGVGMFRLRLRRAEISRPEPEWSALSKEARHLIDAILQLDPMARPTAAHILKHPWMVSAGSGRDWAHLSSAQRSLSRRRSSVLSRDPAVLEQLAHVSSGPTDPPPPSK